MTLAPCPVHGTNYRALHEHNFRGIVTVIQEIITTLSGVGTSSFSLCPVGYTYNFEGVVRALEDLNLTASGVGGTSVLAGSGISIRPSGEFQIFDVNALGINGVNVVYSGQIITISGVNNAATAVVSGIAAGPGIMVTASGGTAVITTDLRGEGYVDFRYDGGTGVISGIANDSLIAGSGVTISTSGDYSLIDVGISAGTNTAVSYSGSLITVSNTAAGGATVVTVSGAPGTNYSPGSLWFDTNEGRLFVYASGNGVASPDWYIANAEALALKGEVPPSGTGLNSPPKDGTLWFNNLMGNLFIYDEATTGWYEISQSRAAAYAATEPYGVVTGSLWVDSSTSVLKVWNGIGWASL